MLWIILRRELQGGFAGLFQIGWLREGLSLMVAKQRWNEMRAWVIWKVGGKAFRKGEKEECP